MSIDLTGVGVFDMEKVPNLFIIGAQKSGPTSLHNYLSSLNDIFPCQIKECASLRNFEIINKLTRNVNNQSFADRKDYQSKMLSGYVSERYIMESTTHYTLGDISEKENIPRVMFHYSPECKIIYILRNPIERLISLYVHQVKMGRFFGTLNQYFATNRNFDISTSCYSSQISNYLKYFTFSSILFLDFENLVLYPKKTLKDVCSFLNIEVNDFDLPDNYKIYNATTRSANMSTKNAFFSHDIYLDIYNTIYADVCELSEMGVDYGWDISPERWGVNSNYDFDAFPNVGHLYLKKSPSVECFIKYFKICDNNIQAGVVYESFLNFLNNSDLDKSSVIENAQLALSYNYSNPYFFHHLANLLIQYADFAYAKEFQYKAIDLDPSILCFHKQLDFIIKNLK